MFKIEFIEKRIEEIALAVFVMFVFSTSIIIVGYFSLYESDMISMIIKAIRFFCYGMCLLIFIYYVLSGKYSKNALIVYAILYSTSIIYLFISKDAVLLKSALLASIVYKIDEDKLIKRGLIVYMMILFTTIILVRLNIIDNYVVTMQERIRDFLGFAYASFASYYYFFTVLLYVCFRKDKLSYYELIIIEIINYYLFLLTDTKYSFFITTLLVLIIIIFKIKPSLKQKLIDFKLLKFLPYILLFITLFLVLMPENELWNKLDMLVTGRLSLAKKGLETFGISIFGQAVELIGYDISAMDVSYYNYVDSSYIQILIKYGIVNLFIILMIYVELIDKAIRKNNVYLLIATILILIVAVFEPYLYDLPFNIFPIIGFSGTCAYEKRK